MIKHESLIFEGLKIKGRRDYNNYFDAIIMISLIGLIVFAVLRI